jgi:hypothetical protein
VDVVAVGVAVRFCFGHFCRTFHWDFLVEFSGGKDWLLITFRASNCTLDGNSTISIKWIVN